VTAVYNLNNPKGVMIAVMSIAGVRPMCEWVDCSCLWL